MSEQPLVSIIIPAYNAEKYIVQAIESVLSQDYQNWELIIINDASKDNTEKAVSIFLNDNRIRIITNTQNLGISKNRNIGIKTAKGKYIAMLDSDDLWLEKNKISKQVNFLENNIDHALVGTFMILIDEQDNLGKKINFAESDNEIRKSIIYKNHIAQSSVMFRKDVAVSVYGYDENLTTMEDHDLWLKMGIKNKLVVLPIYALGYRIHGGSITKSRKVRVALDELHVIWKHKKEYSGFVFGITKGIVRLIKSFL